jgi:hypothetical protein
VVGCGGQVQPEGCAHPVLLERDADHAVVGPVAEAVADEADQVGQGGDVQGVRGDLSSVVALSMMSSSDL